jgi:hypothetical protein
MGSLKDETKRRYEGLQVELSRFNTRRLVPSFFRSDWGSKLEQEFAYRRIEGRLIQACKDTIHPLLNEVPIDPTDFISWLDELPRSGVGANDRIFDWLETSASPTEVKWFIRQEAFAESHLEECVLLTSIRMPPSLGMARLNTPIFSLLAEEFGSLFGERIQAECRAMSNLMMGLASNRHYAFQSLGALSLQPVSTVKRLKSLGIALGRMGIRCILPSEPNWIKESLLPFVRENPDIRLPIAEGALMRMNAASDCYRSYREKAIKPSQPNAGLPF